MYYEYWSMKKAPFDNVPDPSLYWPEHQSVEDAVSEILFSIEEGNDCLAVVTGEVGTGKTLSLRLILNELDSKKYRVAFITNPDLSTLQLMREIVGQLKNKKITSRYKDQLMEEFNALLFEYANQGQKVVIFIDEANVMSVAQLHNLRLMTNLQDDRQNLVTFVLAGQKELDKRLELKSLENLYQRVGVYCRLKGLDSPEVVKQYMNYRLQLCGGRAEIFSQDAYTSIWKYSHHGVPRLVNKIAKLCLKAGETNQVKQINGELVLAISSMFESDKGSSKKETKVTVNSAITPTIASPSPAYNIASGVEVSDLIQGLPIQVRGQLQMMEQKQLRDLAGKMAIQFIEQAYPKNKDHDPVILWDTVKDRIYSALKTYVQPSEYLSLQGH